MNVELCITRDLLPTNLTYETLFIDEERTARLFFDTLGVQYDPVAQPILPTLRKIGDEWSAEAERLVRAERADFLKTVEDDRLTRRFGWKSVLA